MCAALNHATCVENKDEVCIHYGAQAMGDDDARLSRSSLAQRGKDRCFRVCVDCGERIVKDKESRLANGRLIILGSKGISDGT